jgi:hypothetical protein
MELRVICKSLSSLLTTCCKPIIRAFWWSWARDRMGSGVGARLCLSGIATGTPQAFPVASRHGWKRPRRKFPPQAEASGGARRARPHPPGSGPVDGLKGVKRRFLAYSFTPRSPAPPPRGFGLPSATSPCCDRTTAKVSHLHSNQQRLTAHLPHHPDPRRTPRHHRRGSSPRRTPPPEAINGTPPADLRTSVAEVGSLSTPRGGNGRADGCEQQGREGGPGRRVRGRAHRKGGVASVILHRTAQRSPRHATINIVSAGRTAAGATAFARLRAGGQARRSAFHAVAQFLRLPPR